MLELDIVLQRFMEKYFCQLGTEELIQFEKLLSLADNDLWDLICARKTVIDEDLAPVLKLLQDS